MAEAKQRAAAAIGEAGARAEACLVERLDHGSPYFLVTFGDAGVGGAIVMVDAADGSITSSATLERVDRPWMPDEAKAAQIARCSAVARARLVWRPSRATLSPFYPVWELECESGRVYVSRDGEVWHDLPPAGPG